MSRWCPAAGWIDDADLLGDRLAEECWEDQDRRQRQYTRQVCVRLSWAQYEDLAGAAELYGVAPSTMARMIVKRGARAVLDSYRRQDLGFPPG